MPSNKRKTWKNTINVGSEFQAQIPACPSGKRRRVSESKDELLWKPDVLMEEETIEFLKEASGKEADQVDSTRGSHIVDNEKALYELLKCNFDREKALKVSSGVKAAQEEHLAWTKEERQCFEQGLKEYGKDFHQIQAKKLSSRSVAECVEFYYSWKMTDRYRIFLQQNKGGKKFSIRHIRKKVSTREIDDDIAGSSTSSQRKLRKRKAPETTDKSPMKRRRV